MKETFEAKQIARRSYFSGSALAMAISLLSVVVLLIWWQRLLSKNLEIQYEFLRVELEKGTSQPTLKAYVRELDEKLAKELFPDGQPALAVSEISRRVTERLANRKRMVLYEQIFFIALLLSGHVFFLYIYYRERQKRKQTEETVLLATHELRQPLQSLTLALETLSTQSQGSVKKAIRAGLADIERLGLLVKWLSKTFLSDKATPLPTKLSNSKLYLQNIMRKEFSATNRRRIDITSDVPDEVMLPISDELLHFSLRNLIENALQYGEGKVEISVQKTRRTLTFVIKNMAPAIDATVFAKLGNAFYRATSATVQNMGGFGIGLYLTGRTLRKAGGSLSISRVGKLIVAQAEFRIV